MWHCVIFSLLIGFWRVKGEIDCSRSKDSECGHYFEEIPVFPQTLEDFNRVCPHIIGYLSCAIEHSNACGEEIEDEATIRGSLAYLQDACDNDSESYANIEKHLPCIYKQLQIVPESCKNVTENAIQNYIETLEDNNDFCYRGASRMACYVDQVDDKCEDGAKDLALDALRQTKYLNLACNEENTEKTLELLDSLELNPAIKYRIKQLIEL